MFIMQNRSLRMVLLVAFTLVAAGCSCRTKKVGPGGDNIGGLEKEGPLKNVYFAFDSSELSATAKSTLGANADWLKANAGQKTEVQGHCDERGTNEYNMALGARRAHSAMKYLRSLGIGADRMTSVSYGEEVPADPGHNEEAWSKNRRAQFSLK